MNRIKMYQPQLPFPAEVACNRLPKAIQQQSRELLSQLLSEVVMEELKLEKEINDERKD